jgi:NADH dehydrogenase
MTQGLDARPHVVIVGGGFGGLTLAQALAGKPVRVTLLDRTNHHLFQPLLYQVAMAGLSPAEIAQPIRAILRREENVTVLMADATSVDLPGRRVLLADGGSLDWDFVVVSCGMKTSYFGHEEWERMAPGLKSLDDAVEIRERVLAAFELAERTDDAKKREELLTFVVIGGGPTGVELAGALAELKNFVLDRDFRRIDPSESSVVLLEGGERILPSFTPELAESAVAQLHELGVDVRTGKRVTSIEPGVVRLDDPSRRADGRQAEPDTIPSAVVLWAAGVRANDLTASLGTKLDPAGRVFVAPDLGIPGHPRAFVIGDAAHVEDEKGELLPGVSPVAMQQARTVAKSIQRALVGKDTLPFHYFDKGSMATIGRRRAIAQVQRMRMSGLLAWLAWLTVHIFYLIGFKNRFVVMFIWAWSYFTYRRGARLIVGRGGGVASAQPGPRARTLTRQPIVPWYG